MKGRVWQRDYVDGVVASERRWFDKSPEEQEVAMQEFIRDRKDYILEVWEELGRNQDKWDKKCKDKKKK